MASIDRPTRDTSLRAMVRLALLTAIPLAGACGENTPSRPPSDGAPAGDARLRGDASEVRSDAGAAADAALVDTIADARTGGDVAADRDSSPSAPYALCPGGGPAGAAACTGRYRNPFAETGKDAAAIEAKLLAAWKHFYEGGTEQRLYYPVGTDQAYILDANNDDVRSEGMSYGMMVAVQYDKRAEFDRLWRWTTRYMRHATGPRAGYFAWQLGKDGSIRDPNPASDGEAYFATALFFAAARWPGGPIDYGAEARAILRAMLHKEDNGVVDSVTNMFNRDKKMVVFTPYASAALFTDPSYHLPGFYELWARFGREDQAFWRDAAQTSRAFFKTTVHPMTGLAPDYAEFDGRPTGAGHMEFRFDAWRVIANIAFDHAWWAADPWAVTQSRRLLDFFRKEGITSYGNQYEISGKRLSGDHSPGLVAMNALAALALPAGEANDFVEELWNVAPPSGRYRYYDGMLYLMAMLHASGRFQIHAPAP